MLLKLLPLPLSLYSIDQQKKRIIQIFFASCLSCSFYQHILLKIRLSYMCYYANKYLNNNSRNFHFYFLLFLRNEKKKNQYQEGSCNTHIHIFIKEKKEKPTSKIQEIIFVSSIFLFFFK